MRPVIRFYFRTNSERGAAMGNAIARGLLAGMLGGAVGSAAKLAGEAIYPPRTQGQKPPPVVLAEKIAGHELTKKQQTAAAQAFHWTLGIGIGGAYGAVAEIHPAVTLGFGVGLGLAVLLGTHESTLPLLGLSKPPDKQPLREQLSELATHALYGIGVEAVRRLVRSRRLGW
jgi:putative membrane protein